MAVKTFTTGEVLTASDTNTYLNNGGLVYITQITVGTAVATAVVSDCFSSTYDNYRIIINAVDASVSVTTLRLRFDAGGTTNYLGSCYYDKYDGLDTGTIRANAVATCIIGVTDTGDGTSSSFDVYSPNLAKRTRLAGNFAAEGYSGWFSGFDGSTTQHTGFTVLPNSGTLTGGNIRVYGYRQA